MNPVTLHIVLTAVSFAVGWFVKHYNTTSKWETLAAEILAALDSSKTPGDNLAALLKGGQAPSVK